MWHYLPDTAIVNNIEFDHADIYRDEEAYKFAFARFINLVPKNGVVVAGWGSPLLGGPAARAPAPGGSFGFGGGIKKPANQPHPNARGGGVFEKGRRVRAVWSGEGGG